MNESARGYRSTVQRFIAAEPYRWGDCGYWREGRLRRIAANHA